MKIEEAFAVDAPPSAVWHFFEDLERVARCVPGVRSLEILDAGRYRIVAAQKVGFISATFEVATTRTGQEPLRYIEFASTGKSIAGAVATIRSRDRIDFEPHEGGTRVRLTSELTVGGMLGALGHKAIGAKSRELTEQFAAALREALQRDPEGA